MDAIQGDPTPTPIPTFVITPVADIVKKMKGMEQATLTQLLGLEHAHDTDDGGGTDDDPDFVHKRPAPEKVIEAPMSPLKKAAVDTSMEMPIDMPIRQLKKAKLATPVKPVKNWSFQSNSKSDQKNPNSAKLGDLVMSTARELDHPDFKTGKIDGAYIFFGIVRKYSQTTVPQRERIWVDWSQVEKGHSLIKSENKKKTK